MNDLKFALRQLLKNPGFTAVSVLTLALGIGANTAVFSVINGVLLRTVPVDHPETLVRFRWFGENQMGNSFSSYGYVEPIEGNDRDTDASFPFAIYEQFRAANTTMVDLFACVPQGQLNVIYNGQPIAVVVARSMPEAEAAARGGQDRDPGQVDLLTAG